MVKNVVFSHMTTCDCHYAPLVFYKLSRQFNRLLIRHMDLLFLYNRERHYAPSNTIVKMQKYGSFISVHSVQCTYFFSSYLGIV